MDYVVHINNGNEPVRPIVLRLLPGEETIFELRVVNHGDPSNISVDTSPHLLKAMRLKRSNHYVEMEEIIPVLARMPDNLDRLDGEIMVNSDRGSNRVPVSLISEAESTWKKGKVRDYGPKSVEIMDSDDEADIDDADVDDEDGYEAGERETDIGKANAYESDGSDVAEPTNDSYGYGGYSRSRRMTSERIGEENSQDIQYGVQGDAVEEDVEAEESKGGDLFELGDAAGQILPVIMLAMIAVVLVLTFYTSTIPEFIGALTSSILIVTLITYGAATLLKT